ncbi:hypothetical protein FWG76_02480 [Candidatus Saccharibacteria bacterium]|nr:hypothetical protein [Candidatus Saccharibacteria bacterium]
MDNISAVWAGRLASNSLFFGGAQAEITSISPTTGRQGGWNADFVSSANSSVPWFVLGARTGNNDATGIFAFYGESGNASAGAAQHGHRTILLGY